MCVATLCYIDNMGYSQLFNAFFDTDELKLIDTVSQYFVDRIKQYDNVENIRYFLRNERRYIGLAENGQKWTIEIWATR